MEKTRVGKVLAVEWVDAWQNDGYYTFEEIQREGPKVVISYGLCIKDDKQGIAIGMDDLRPHKDERFRDVKFIPHVMITGVKELR